MICGTDPTENFKKQCDQIRSIFGTTFRPLYFSTVTLIPWISSAM
ncbi:hypothetical protein CEXT_194621, partial [Caerostris extrusa]